jgi:hypothetical protein
MVLICAGRKEVLCLMMLLLQQNNVDPKMFPSKINGCSVKGVAVAHKYTYFFETTSVVNIKKKQPSQKLLTMLTTSNNKCYHFIRYTFTVHHKDYIKIAIK